jgi:hypothetical protein
VADKPSMVDTHDRFKSLISKIPPHPNSLTLGACQGSRNQSQSHRSIEIGARCELADGSP